MNDRERREQLQEEMREWVDEAKARAAGLPYNDTLLGLLLRIAVACEALANKPSGGGCSYGSPYRRENDGAAGW